MYQQIKVTNRIDPIFCSAAQGAKESTVLVAVLGI
jgi:hypothetical protein